MTPARNEAWILDRFLRCASLWADHIIVADQQSDDATAAIAQRFDKVILVSNSSEFDERSRQQLLLAEARKLPGPRLLIALDADECLTANYAQSPEWQTVLSAPPGTVVRFKLIELAPGLRACCHSNTEYVWGFVDDGSAHEPRVIHSHRVPDPRRVPSVALNEVRVLHYQHTNLARLRSKRRWYQCWERLHFPDKSPSLIAVSYHMAWPARRSDVLEPIERAWLDGYTERGIDMTSTNDPPHYWWDLQVLDWFDTYGVNRFRRLNIWDYDWCALATRLGRPHAGAYRDPRTRAERAIQRCLPIHHSLEPRWSTFAAFNVLRRLGW